jgi:hypothetical protein
MNHTIFEYLKLDPTTMFWDEEPHSSQMWLLEDWAVSHVAAEMFRCPLLCFIARKTRPRNFRDHPSSNGSPDFFEAFIIEG